MDLAGRAAKHQAATGVVDRDRGRGRGRPTVALVAAATAAGVGGFVAAAAVAVQCPPVLVLSTWKGRA